MANFDQAYSLLLSREGGYYWYSGDFGGETYAGISRVHFPFIPLWQIVDLVKKELAITSTIDNPTGWQKLTDELGKNKNVFELKKQFYFNNFWKQIAGETIENQPLANYIYDMAVNHGKENAVRWLQMCIVSLGENPYGQRKWPIVGIDGIMFDGGETVASLNAITKDSKQALILAFALKSMRAYCVIDQGIKSQKYRAQSEGLIERIKNGI